MEEWKFIFEDYEISNFGNCRRKGKEIKGCIQNKGYKYFQVQRDGKRINKLFHHLVAEAFIGERQDNLVIDHIDRNKLNNNVSNLRYVSQAINMQNTSRYRNDIETKDKKERHKIINSEYRIKNGKNRGIRRKCGTGGISYRKDIRKWRVTKKINGIKILDKSFNTKEEANDFLNNN